MIQSTMLIWEGDLECFERRVAQSRGLRVRVRLWKHGRSIRHEWSIQDPAREVVWFNPKTPRENLWQGTCFEMFIVSGVSAAYTEWNVQRTGLWNRYRFRNYRDRVTEGPSSATVPPFEVTEMVDHSGTLILFEVPEVLPSKGRLGLSMMMETRHVGMLHWSLAHPKEKPDFHKSETYLSVQGGRAWKSD